MGLVHSFLVGRKKGKNVITNNLNHMVEELGPASYCLCYMYLEVRTVSQQAVTVSTQSKVVKVV